MALPGDVDPGGQRHRLPRLRTATGRFRRMLLPIRIAEIIAEMRAALALKLSHDDLTRYNAVQRLLYIGIIVVVILQVLSGLVIWKPVQFSELASSSTTSRARASCTSWAWSPLSASCSCMWPWR